MKEVKDRLKAEKNIFENAESCSEQIPDVEKAKQALSSQHQARIEIELFFGDQDFSETLSQATFEELNMDFFRNTLKPVQKVLDDADLQKNEVDGSAFNQMNDEVLKKRIRQQAKEAAQEQRDRASQEQHHPTQYS